MIVEKLLRNWNRFSGLADNHNKAVAVTITVRTMAVNPNPDGLIEVVVKNNGELGWIYDKSMNFVSYPNKGTIQIIETPRLKDYIEKCARKSGKAESETPKANHIRRADDNVYYYITEEELLSLKS